MISRKQLEEWISVPDARNLVDEFFGDRATYPDKYFYTRKRGINKDIPEEFYPLLLLAEHLPSAICLRLSPNSVPGPDGAILLTDKSEIRVQVTMSHERDEGYKVRHRLRDYGMWCSGIFRTDEIIKRRLERIITSLKDKEVNFYTGTDVLLIVDESIAWGVTIDPALPDALHSFVNQLPASKYSAVYVAYGIDIRKLR